MVIIPYGKVTPMFLGEHSKGIPFPITYREEKGELMIRVTKGRGIF